MARPAQYIKQLLLLLCIFSISTAFSQKTFKQELDTLCTVDFPAKPAFKYVKNYKIYSAVNSHSFYSVLIQPVISSLEKDSLTSFYQGTIEGNLQSAKGKLISKKNILIDGFKGIEFEYTSGLDKKLPLRFQRVIFLNGRIFNFLFWTSADSLAAKLSQKNTFFNSIAVKADKSSIKQYTDEGSAFKIGYAFGYAAGKIFSVVSIVCLLIGIIMLVRKTILKRKRINK